MKTVKIRPMLCLKCGWKIDSAAFRPRPGQISSCYNCGLLTMWMPDGGIRVLLPDDIEKMNPKVRTELALLMRNWLKVREAEGWKDYTREEGGGRA